MARLVQLCSILPSSCYQLIIINNFPSEQSELENLQNESVKLIESGENLGFSRACNLGLNWIYSQNSQSIVWLINPDTFIEPDMITKAVPFIQNHSHISILGTLIYSTDNKIWFGGGTFTLNRLQAKITSENLFVSSPHKDYIPCDWVSGCSMIINFRHFPSCPQFDSHYFLYYEDFDFCQRYRQQGHLVAVTKEISIIHEVSAITNGNLKSKFYHSTYSYLLTLERYTNQCILSLRLLRLLTYALILLPIKPPIALGKIIGTWYYFKKKFWRVDSSPN